MEAAINVRPSYQTSILSAGGILKLDLSDFTESSISFTFEHLRGHIESLKELRLVLPKVLRVDQVDDALSKLLSELLNLECLKLPQFFLSENIVTAIARHPKLKQLSHSDKESFGGLYNSNGCKL
ncbi:hypothetical protein FRC02_011041 [Tulasnella sp. 418]|nr:hypothetical protein FRC02_011041 [Tulasnella sp. 418]